MSSNEQLRDFMDYYKLTIRETAKLAGLSSDTIKAYTANPKSKRFRHAPESVLKFLKNAMERKTNRIAQMNERFETLIKEMEKFLAEEYGVETPKIGFIQESTKYLSTPSDEFYSPTTSIAKKFQVILNRAHDLWASYIELDLDESMYDLSIKENEELQKIAELQNDKSLSEEDKKLLSSLMEKHHIIASHPNKVY